MFSPKIILVLAAILLTPLTSAHTWVEELRNLNTNGSYTDSIGYPRGFFERDTPGWSDPMSVYMIEDAENGPDPNICKASQIDSSAASQRGFPRLNATIGDGIAFRYLENGHVTLFTNNIGKPLNRGTWYIYGTQDPSPNDKFYSIYQRWNSDGTGGDKIGRLISTQNYDDSQCYENNPSPLSQKRQADLVSRGSAIVPPQSYGGDNLPCQVNIIIPDWATDNTKPLTLYAVWKWDTSPNLDPALMMGKNQTYTACMDIDLKPGTGKAFENYKFNANDVNLRKAAVPAVFDQLSKGNIFVTTSFPIDADGHIAGPVSGSSSSDKNPPPPATSTASTMASTAAPSITAPADGIATETIYIYSTSTGTASPTQSGLSLSTLSASPTASSVPVTASVPARTSATPVATSAPATTASASVTTSAPSTTSTAATSTAALGSMSIEPVPTTGSFTDSSTSTTASATLSATVSTISTSTIPASTGSVVSASSPATVSTALGASSTGTLHVRGFGAGDLAERSDDEKRDSMRVHARQFRV